MNYGKLRWKVTLQDRKRILILFIGILALLTVLIIQFYRLQILQGEKWQNTANEQHYFSIKEPFLRGVFYSNTTIKKGHPQVPQKLVIDIQKFHLYVDPDAISNDLKEEIATALLSFITVSDQELKRFHHQFNYKSRSRKLASWQDQHTKDSILKWWRPYARQHRLPSNAIFFVNDYQRTHPFGKMLGQVLHTVQEQKEELSKQAMPTGGLEMSMHPFLTGKLGKRRLMRSARHALEMGEVIESPENGADVYLTINHYLQAVAEEEIEYGVKRCKAKSGWAVMLDPYTGHILALAQYPFFYPDQYQDYFNRFDFIENTKVKAITDAHEPGSMMKPVTIAIALKANAIMESEGKKALFHPLEKIAVSDGRFPGRSKHIRDTHKHYYLNMYMGVQKSSNIYVARLVQRIIESLGNDWYRNELNQTFGFGMRTQVELPGESAGVLPTPGKLHPNGKLEWSVPTPFSLAFGHNIQATSLQMLRVYAIFANGGYFVQPTLIRQIIKNQADGTKVLLLDNTCPDRYKLCPRVIDEQIIREVVKAMKFTTKRGGTAFRADIMGYTEAGKTGTSEKIVNGVYSKNTHYDTFIGFAPVEKPAFVLLVGIDEPPSIYIPGQGMNQLSGMCAAPVFREIARRSLEYLGVTPDDPFGYPKGDPRHDPSKADWVAETEKLRELYEFWNQGASEKKTKRANNETEKID